MLYFLTIPLDFSNKSKIKISDPNECIVNDYREN